MKEGSLPEQSKMRKLKTGLRDPLTNFFILKTETPRPNELSVPRPLLPELVVVLR